VTIAGNWTLYVWAVAAKHNLQASLGYYINPLINMAIGGLIFRERINRIGWTAIGLAAVGVVIQTAAIGHLPLVSLVLALSFCAYGVIRRQVAAVVARLSSPSLPRGGQTCGGEPAQSRGLQPQTPGSRAGDASARGRHRARVCAGRQPMSATDPARPTSTTRRLRQRRGRDPCSAQIRMCLLYAYILRAKLN